MKPRVEPIKTALEMLEERLTKGFEHFWNLEREGKMGSPEYEKWFPEWHRLLVHYEYEKSRSPSADQSALGL